MNKILNKINGWIDAICYDAHYKESVEKLRLYNRKGG